MLQSSGGLATEHLMPPGSHIALYGAALALIAAARSAAGQVAAGQRVASLSGGAIAGAYGGVAAGALLAARLDQVLPGRWLLAEGELAYAVAGQSGAAAHFAGLGLQLQLQVPFRQVQPFLGLGGGVAGQIGRSGGVYQTWDGMVSVGAGVRVVLRGELLARAEARARYTPGLAGHTGELTLGLGWRVR